MSCVLQPVVQGHNENCGFGSPSRAPCARRNLFTCEQIKVLGAQDGECPISFVMPRHDRLQHTMPCTIGLKTRLHVDLLWYITVQYSTVQCPFSSQRDYQCAKQFVSRIRQNCGDVFSRLVLWPGETRFSGWKCDLVHTSDMLKGPE